MSDDLSDGPIDYDRLKAATRTLRRPLKSLYALDDDTDPFGAGTPGRRQRAEWIAGLWPRLEFRAGVHIRRVHYKLVSLPELVTRHNGEPYQNTYACWKGLGNAIRDARFLGLLPPNVIDDHRNPRPAIYFAPRSDTTAMLQSKGGYACCLAPEASLSDFSIGVGKVDVQLPEVPHLALRVELHNPFLTLPRLSLAHPPSIAERYMFEIWVEKSTLNDVVSPLAQRLDVNVVVGTGDMSATQCEQFVERARRSGKPVRILFVSDFDPQGENMPCGVARKIEFALRNLPENERPDVRVSATALTYRQCVEFQLPRTPMKETERRADKWGSRYGEGQTEVDALEACAPGALERILQAEVERYRDDTIDDRIEEAAAVYRRRLEAINAEVRAKYADEIAAVEAVINAGRAEIEQMREGVATLVNPMREELTLLTTRMRRDLMTLADRMRQELEQATEQLREEGERVTAPMRDALERQLATIRERITQIDGNLRELARPLLDKMQAELGAPDHHWPEPVAQEDPDPLYDSKRGYLDQLDRYHKHQGKAKLTKLRNLRSYSRVCADPDCGKTFTTIKSDQELCRRCYQKHYQRKRKKAQHGKAANQGTLPSE
jgi:hypothetical protein